MRTSNKRILCLVGPVLLGLAPLVAGATQITIKFTPHEIKPLIFKQPPQLGHGPVSGTTAPKPTDNNLKDVLEDLQNQVNSSIKNKDKDPTVPEPGVWSLFVLGAFGLGIAARKRRAVVRGSTL